MSFPQFSFHKVTSLIVQVRRRCTVFNEEYRMWQLSKKKKSNVQIMLAERDGCFRVCMEAQTHDYNVLDPVRFNFESH